MYKPDERCQLGASFLSKAAGFLRLGAPWVIEDGTCKKESDRMNEIGPSMDVIGWVPPHIP